MIKKMKTILLTLAVFLMILAPAHASVNVETVELTPNNPKTSANLACNYTVTASNGEVLEQVNLTWYNGSETHAETPLPLTDNTNQTSGTRTLISTNTRKGENWKCEVHALGNASNESTTDSSTVIYNTIPVMSNIGNKEVNVDKSLSFTVNTQDADATDGTDELTYELNNAPVGMEIDGNRITWRPDMEQKGTHEVDVIVTDNEGANDMASFSVEVYQMMLAVEDLDVDCSPSCDDNLDEEDGGSIEEVRPGSTMELEINLENLWDEDVDDHDIEDIEIIGTLEDMGDEDEQEEEEEIGKLDPEEEDSVTLKFDIPEETDEDTYDLELEITGEDEDGTDYEIILDIEVDVEKEDDDIIFKRAQLQPTTVSCYRDVTLRVEVKNIGADDQDGVELAVENGALGISDSQFFDLEEGDYDDDDTEYEKTYNFDIDDSINEGTYDIEIKAYYEDSGKYELKRLPLTVRDCDRDSTSSSGSDDDSTSTENGDEEESQEVEVIENKQPPTQQKEDVTKAQPIDESSTKESFYDSTTFLVLLGLTFVILLGGVIALAVIAFKK